MRKVLIADSSEEWCECLTEALEQKFRVFVCRDGVQAMEKLNELFPDVLVVDLMLPGLDGLSLVRNLQNRPSRPRIIVTGGYISSFAASALERCRVDAMLLKPSSAESIAELIGEMLRDDLSPSEPLPFDQITSLLVQLGTKTSQQGFRFLRYGITLLLEDPCQQLTKRLYPAIAREFGTTAVNVEKSMRTAVTTAWKNRRDSVWYCYFAAAANGQIPRPTTGQFLSRLSDAVRCTCRKQFP